MALLILGGLAFTAMAVFLTVALVGTVIHFAVRIILLPLLLLKFILMGTVMLWDRSCSSSGDRGSGCRQGPRPPAVSASRHRRWLMIVKANRRPALA
jgi:hypothetical protein